jgi:hypothetical protein
MPPLNLPPLPLAEWQPTRRTVHGYVQVLGAIRGALAPHQKQSYHRSLHVAAAGLTTTPIGYGPLTFELLLNLAQHRVTLTTNQGGEWHAPLTGQPVSAFYDQVLGALKEAGVSAPVDRQSFISPEAGVYDRAAVGRFWSALSQVDAVLRRFRGELREETGAVQLWPHGLDIAFLWFSGRRVPGREQAKPSHADEQMNFGFSTGDGGIPEPYFYATAYPLPAALPSAPLPRDVVWHSQGWNGAVLRYAALVGAPDAEERLLGYWRGIQQAGARLMR